MSTKQVVKSGGSLEGKVMPNTDQLDKFLELQQKELVLREKEFENEQLKDKYDFDFAKSAMQAEVADREAERKLKKSQTKTLIFSFLACVVLLLSFFCYCLYLGKDQIISEIIKIILYGGSGSLGGWAVGSKKKQ